MSEVTEEIKQEEPTVAIPAGAVAAYLSEVYRQLDNIMFNLRTNINNITPKTEGENTNGNSQE
jgi:hypothetical protein